MFMALHMLAPAPSILSLSDFQNLQLNTKKSKRLILQNWQTDFYFEENKTKKTKKCCQIGSTKNQNESTEFVKKLEPQNDIFLQFFDFLLLFLPQN